MMHNNTRGNNCNDFNVFTLIPMSLLSGIRWGNAKGNIIACRAHAGARAMADR
jgi:hypothetical protein